MAATPSNNVQRPPANVIAALSYLVGFVTGIIFMYVEPYDKDDYVQFHAYQSIVFSVAVFAFNVVVGVFIAVLPRGLGGLFSFVQELANFGLAVLWIYLMYQAYIGHRWRLPVLSDLMDSMRAPHA